jgi:hypothetical protein
MLALAVGVVFGVGGIAAQSALAAAPFQRGDVFSDGAEYSPSGQLVQAIPAIGDRAACFDPSGRHLIVPGVGLFDNSGNLLPSNWAAVTGYHCVADGYGNVYVNGGIEASTVAKYDIKGDLIETFTLPYDTVAPPSLDLAPDECTLYYSEGFPLDAIGRFDVCTNSPETAFASVGPILDDIRVLPNWQVVGVFDTASNLFDVTGQSIQGYAPPFGTDTLRSASLDPDGTSVWICCAGGLLRYDINSGSLLSQLTGIGDLSAVYGPPLFGNADVAPNVDSNPAGTAEAFLTRVRYSGQMTRLHLYVGSSSTATQAIVGIYSNRLGQPGVLQAQGTIANLRPGSWNYVDLPSMSVTAGQRYWIAVLSPSGGGKVSFRDRRLGGLAFTSRQHQLTALPAHWSSNLRDIRLSGAVSGYGG